MATRRPLVVISGSVQELPAGDAVASATADTLTTARAIQGVPFDGSVNIDVISIGSTAPASPTTNQLWIQTP